MDIRMKELSGLDASAEILKEFPDAKILLLTTFSDDEYIVRALKLGAKGYLLKQDYESLIPALHAVHSGQTVFGNEIISKIPELLQTGPAFHLEDYDISERELEIIRLIADGLSNKEIASRLFLSEGTVRNYLSSILDKLDLRDRTQVAVFITGISNQFSTLYRFPDNIFHTKDWPFPQIRQNSDVSAKQSTGSRKTKGFPAT